MMFLSAVIPLTALDSAPSEQFGGRHAMAAVLSAIGKQDPALANSLHVESDARRPFTVSPVLQLQSRPQMKSSIQQGEHYLVRLTSMDADLSRRLLMEILPAFPATMRIGAVEFQVGQALTESSQHPLARQASAEAVYEQWFSRTTPVEKRIGLEFFSPTAIKSRGRNLVVPLPVSIFQGYVRAWNQFARPAIAEDVLEIIERDVVITQYDLRTQVFSLRELPDREQTTGEAQKQIGFLGRCAFTCFAPERALWRTLHLLADFAFFCGTGYKTTQGMGQTRKVRMKDEG